MCVKFSTSNVAYSFCLIAISLCAISNVIAKESNPSVEDVSVVKASYSRYRLDDEYQKICRMSLLRSEKAVSALLTEGITMSQVCDCASSMQVSGMSDNQVKNALASTGDSTKSMNNMLQHQIYRCTVGLMIPKG